MTAFTAEGATRPDLQRVRRAIVVVDVVESVRLMQQHEDDVIDRWRRFVNEVVAEVLPPLGGRLVKSLGDGMLLEFARAPQAVTAALQMQLRVGALNAGRDASAAINLRVGANLADVVVDDLDIYGSGVNLAARLAGIAAPGEIVASLEVRDQLTPSVDCRIDDMGECYVKHLEGTVRAFRIGDASMVPLVAAADGVMTPGIAVIPLSCRSSDVEEISLGDAVADDIIAALSRNRALRVISRLSTAALRGPGRSLDDIRKHLDAAYAVSGRLSVRSGIVRLHFELCDCRDGAVLWADAFDARVEDIFAGADDAISTVVSQVSQCVAQNEMQRIRSLPLPNLQSYSLYLGGVTMLHRLAPADFTRSRQIFLDLADRVPRSAAPHSMLAKWHVLQLVQGWSEDPPGQARLAQAAARRAVELDPQDAFGLAVDGLVSVHSGGDLAIAESRYQQAIHANPQEPLAWALTAGLHSYQGQGGQAVLAADQAMRLSPLDPERFLFEAYAALACIVAGDHARAMRLADSSIRHNALHAPSHRLRVIAMALGGDVAGARTAALKLLQLEPRTTVDDYRRRYPGRDLPHARLIFEALAAAGVPR